jgi:hypothetical protein
MKEEPEDAAERMRDAQLKYGEKVLMAVMRHKDCIYFKEVCNVVYRTLVYWLYQA